MESLRTRIFYNKSVFVLLLSLAMKYAYTLQRMDPGEQKKARFSPLLGYPGCLSSPGSEPVSLPGAFSPFYHLAKRLFRFSEKSLYKVLTKTWGSDNIRRVKRKTLVCAGEPVAIAKRVHPFPSRTRKLSSSALMILWGQPHGKIRRRRFTRPHGRFFYCFSSPL